MTEHRDPVWFGGGMDTNLYRWHSARPDCGGLFSYAGPTPVACPGCGRNRPSYSVGRRAARFAGWTLGRILLAIGVALLVVLVAFGLYWLATL